MPRGEANHIKVHYRGHGDEDFLVFVDNVEDYHKWLHDRSVPLSHVVSSFKVFTTHK
jgi:Shwachman-Bodian-Diamond syndrome (SBDS) protein.